MKPRSTISRAITALALAVCAGSAFSQARVQIVHAAPFSDTLENTSVTVSVDGAPVLEEFLFGHFTDDIELPAGTYDLAVTLTFATDPEISAYATATLEDGVDYTVLAVGDGVKQPLALWPLVDAATGPGAGQLNLRVVHAAPFATGSSASEVSIRTAGGDVVAGLEQLAYSGESGFFTIDEGSYDLKVTSPDGQTNLIDPLPVDLAAGLDVTVIAIGDGVNQPLGILALPIGELPTRAPVDVSANGWWDTGNSENEGLILQPIPAQNRLIGTIYTYEDDGSTRWFVLDGPFDGRVSNATVFRAEGGAFAGQVPAEVTEAGTIDVEIVDCTTGTAAIDLDTGESVTWDLERLVQAVPCTLD